MNGKKGFVSSDHMLALFDGPEDESSGRLEPPDEFDDDGDFRVLEHIGNLGGEKGLINLHPPVGGHIQIGDFFEYNGKA